MKYFPSRSYVEVWYICRWVDDSLQPNEGFLGIYAMEKTTSEAIVGTIKDVLLRYGLPLVWCHGQWYDGAAVMSGAKSGVVVRIKNVSHFLP